MRNDRLLAVPTRRLDNPKSCSCPGLGWRRTKCPLSWPSASRRSPCGNGIPGRNNASSRHASAWPLFGLRIMLKSAGQQKGGFLPASSARARLLLGAASRPVYRSYFGARRRVALGQINKPANSRTNE